MFFNKDITDGCKLTANGTDSNAAQSRSHKQQLYVYDQKHLSFRNMPWEAVQDLIGMRVDVATWDQNRYFQRDSLEGN